MCHNHMHVHFTLLQPMLSISACNGMQIYIDIEYSDSLITNEQFQFNGNTIFTKKIMLLNLFHSRMH